MGIVLNEREYVEGILERYELGVKPTETLSRVARYYSSLEGIKRSEVRAELEKFMLRCDPTINLVKWQDTIDRIMKSASKFPLIYIESVPITEKEMEVCDSLTGVQPRRLLFTLICLAKYSDLVNDKNGGWVNRQDKEIFRLANVVTSIKRQSLMLNDFRAAGLIRFSRKVDNVNINVLCMDKDSPTVLEVKDFRNLGYQYMRFHGEPYIECAQCGLVIKKRSNAHKYCHECAIDVNRQRTRDRVGVESEFKAL